MSQPQFFLFSFEHAALANWLYKEPVKLLLDLKFVYQYANEYRYQYMIRFPGSVAVFFASSLLQVVIIQVKC